MFVQLDAGGFVRVQADTASTLRGWRWAAEAALGCIHRERRLDATLRESRPVPPRRATVGNEFEAPRLAHGATPTWALENHDIVQSVTQFCSGELLLTQARAALVALPEVPGAACFYDGQELGPPEVDVPVGPG
ncbi:hypothetical protein ACFVTM_17205 [Arthrobacter sp. NPDC058130]|uniref:hypothetical protein n=1 Tax=Arthrobacter sp. NPDC058130 TaxID=3346353 RepID=UPI0036E83EF9